jgi:hypothetical protein
MAMPIWKPIAGGDHRRLDRIRIEDPTLASKARNMFSVFGFSPTEVLKGSEPSTLDHAGLETVIRPLDARIRYS